MRIDFRQTSKRRQFAFTKRELMVVVTVIAVLIAFLLPGFLKRCEKAAQTNCVYNLKVSWVSSFSMWAIDHGEFYPMQYRTNNFDGPSYANSEQMYIYFKVMSNELNTPKILICPEDRQRRAATNFTTDFNSSRISYFVGLDASDTSPDAILMGDSNLQSRSPASNGVLELSASNIPAWNGTRHVGGGNIVLGDGSIQKWSNRGLSNAVVKMGQTPARIVLPEDVK